MSRVRLAMIPLFLAGLLGESRGDEGGVADLVTLRDGQVLRGEVLESSARTVVALVRRGWARDNLTDWPVRWEALEKATLVHAIKRRRERLETWGRDRERKAGGNALDPSDRIGAWIVAERSRLDAYDPENAPLITVRLGRSDVKGVRAVDPVSHSLLRLGWLSGFPGVEETSADVLKQALEGRGFDLSQPGEVSVEALLPPSAESDQVWLTRRAATEVLHDPGLRFVKYQGLILPDDGSAGAAMPSGIEAVAALRGLLGDERADPLATRLREVEESGRVGALLTRLDMPSDFSSVTVEVGMLARTAPGRWIPLGSRSVRVRPDDLPAQAGDALGDDPRVASAIRLVEALGLGEVSPERKRRVLTVGAATRQALASARAAAERDLNRLAFPVLIPPLP